MSAKYLLRFDDICPTMNWRVWAEIEAILWREGISPILAVVPDNRDPKLRVDREDPRFWQRVRYWQSQGWTIGLHGYQHCYVTREAGLLRLNRYSEFAGLPAPEQEAKLRRAAAILQQEGVHPQVWIAPAHSFDGNTLTGLQKINLRIVSDGFAPLPHLDARGMLWLPQQLWDLQWRPGGVWTVCYHHNSWGPGELARFRRQVRRFRKAITSFPEIVHAFGNRRRHPLDGLLASLLWCLKKGERHLGRRRAR